MTSNPLILPEGGVRIIELLAYPAVQMLDVTGPLQVFATANEMAERAGEAAPYSIRVVGKGGGTILASSGLGFATQVLPPSSAPIDTLIIAGGPGVDAVVADHRTVAWVRRRAMKARRVASVCTGAFLLASTGQLEGRRAVTHWSFCNELARRYPSIVVEPDPIFIADGPVWTSAGVTAGIDLALALVEQDLGREMALAVARYLVVFLKRPGGQAQFSAALSLQVADEQFGLLHDWIRAHLSSDLSISKLAARVAMSERNFCRQYLRATGRTPARAVEAMRVEAARRMLSDSTSSIKRIAARCGFGSEETMRRSFHRLLVVSPHDYRTRFAGKVLSDGGGLESQGHR